MPLGLQSKPDSEFDKVCVKQQCIVYGIYNRRLEKSA